MARWLRRALRLRAGTNTTDHPALRSGWASVAVAKHREVLLSVGFSTWSTKKIAHAQLFREQGLRNRGTR